MAFHNIGTFVYAGRGNGKSYFLDTLNSLVYGPQEKTLLENYLESRHIRR